MYANDPRIEPVRDHNGNVVGYVLQDPDEDIFIEPDQFDMWTIRTKEGGYLTDPGDRYNRRPLRLDTADEAIAYIIGEPCVTATDDGCYVVAATDDLSWLVFPEGDDWWARSTIGQQITGFASAADAVNGALVASREMVA